MNNCKKNFGFTHKSGILMPIFSLPSPYGIGTLGKAAFDFVDFLDRCGTKCWQVLPLCPTAFGDSPYQSPASIAGNPYLIDPDLLFEAGLLTKKELAAAKHDTKRIDYGHLFATRFPLLRRAYARFEPNAAYRTFCRKHADWLEDYALFMSLKVKYDYRPFPTWESEHRDVQSARAHASDFSFECGFWRFVQFIFFEQWTALHDHARRKGISIIGDLPIYVAHDSMDVWRAPEQFLLDERLYPTEVAGCPPDSFAVDGQLWGNPLYRWDLMREQGFSWWIDRIKKSLSLFDLLRIDHFRGFASFYAIPYGAPNARNGTWRQAPGRALFDAIHAQLPHAKLIAEDLGFITDDVRDLLSYTGFPGMKILQFAFDEEQSEHLPKHFATDNCMAYTGSHDSSCTRTWYGELRTSAKKRVLHECPKKEQESITEAMIALAMHSRANLCVIPMQDHLGLTDAKGRMNTPSRPEGNWTWRLPAAYGTERTVERILSVTRAAGREK